MKLKEASVVALKGFGMGAANVVPGVSGGTIALLTGIYSRIIDSLDSLTRRETWKSLFSGRFREFWKLIGGDFLLALAVGVVASVFLLASLMTRVLESYPILTWAFFFGLILASAFFMFRDIDGWDWKCVLLTLAGAAAGVAFCTLTPTTTPDGLWFIFIVGAVSICSMILPGISGSFVLLIFGKYDHIMEAVSSLDLKTLAVFGLGCLVGLLSFARLLHYLMKRWEKQTMLALLGFVLGSLVKIWPWQEGVAAGESLQIPGAVLWCLLGAGLVAALELLGRKRK